MLAVASMVVGWVVDNWPYLMASAALICAPSPVPTMTRWSLAWWQLMGQRWAAIWRRPETQSLAKVELSPEVLHAINAAIAAAFPAEALNAVVQTAVAAAVAMPVAAPPPNNQQVG